MAALACVIGEADLVMALALAGIRSAVFGRPQNPAYYLSAVDERLAWVDLRGDPAGAVDRLLEFARRQPEPPVLYFDGDWGMLLVSRHRDRLAGAFRFLLPDPELVEDLTDKARFMRLARELDLPVPAAQVVDGDAAGLAFPLLVKPLTRDHATWRAGGKAILARDAAELRALGDGAFLAQEIVPGPECAIESYHVYVDAGGAIAGEFTGRKLRTYPREFGYSTAVTVTPIDDVRALGRALVARLGLRGVAKLDFKRAPDGTLWLLEVNARFNLWHHPGAHAGVNLPALVYADLTGRPRPPAAFTRSARWCTPRHDYLAARDEGMRRTDWLRFAAGCEAKFGFEGRSPLPLARAGAWRVRARLR